MAFLPLWCDTGGLTSPASSSTYESDVREFVQKAHDHGVTRLFPSGGSPEFVEAAKEKGIDVHPYVALNRHGGVSAKYAWSIESLVPQLGTAEARVILDRHRPVYSHRDATFNASEFANNHPDSWSLTRGGNKPSALGEFLSLSFADERARKFETDKYVGLITGSGGAGTQTEFVLGNTDEGGVTTGGYEPIMAQAFEAKYGRNPEELPNDDPDWMQFRADYVTLFLAETREAVKEIDPNLIYSTTMIAADGDDYVKVSLDPRAWVAQDLMDEYYIWFRTTSDLDEVRRQTRWMADTVGGRRPFTVQLSCYHPGSFQDPHMLLEGARVALDNGADHVGVYRSHAVEQLGLWHILSEIGRLNS